MRQLDNKEILLTVNQLLTNDFLNKMLLQFSTCSFYITIEYF